jgi:hypothetical protein
MRLSIVLAAVVAILGFSISDGQAQKRDFRYGEQPQYHTQSSKPTRTGSSGHTKAWTCRTGFKGCVARGGGGSGAEAYCRICK